MLNHLGGISSLHYDIKNIILFIHVMYKMVLQETFKHWCTQLKLIGMKENYTQCMKSEREKAQERCAVFWYHANSSVSHREIIVVAVTTIVVHSIRYSSWICILLIRGLHQNFWNPKCCTSRQFSGEVAKYYSLYNTMRTRCSELRSCLRHAVLSLWCLIIDNLLYCDIALLQTV